MLPWAVFVSVSGEREPAGEKITQPTPLLPRAIMMGLVFWGVWTNAVADPETCFGKGWKGRGGGVADIKNVLPYGTVALACFCARPNS